MRTTYLPFLIMVLVFTGSAVAQDFVVDSDTLAIWVTEEGKAPEPGSDLIKDFEPNRNLALKPLVHGEGIEAMNDLIQKPKPSLASPGLMGLPSNTSRGR